LPDSSYSGLILWGALTGDASGDIALCMTQRSLSERISSDHENRTRNGKFAACLINK